MLLCCLHFSTVSRHREKKMKEKGNTGDKKPRISSKLSLLNWSPQRQAKWGASRKKNRMENLSWSINWQKISKFSSGLLKYILQITFITCRMRAFKGITWLNHWNLGLYIPRCACWKWHWQFQKKQHLGNLKVQSVESDVLGITQNILKTVTSATEKKPAEVTVQPCIPKTAVRYTRWRSKQQTPYTPLSHTDKQRKA